mmetsp:Transcript_41678/g.97723  ORF Transcript_41678/g.97723 Transcript_41678/m.97723 type:complete len:219 (-) Transcript_41678:642-1298(-)
MHLLVDAFGTIDLERAADAPIAAEEYGELEDMADDRANDHRLVVQQRLSVLSSVGHDESNIHCAPSHPQESHLCLIVVSTVLPFVDGHASIRHMVGIERYVPILCCHGPQGNHQEKRVHHDAQQRSQQRAPTQNGSLWSTWCQPIISGQCLRDGPKEVRHHQQIEVQVGQRSQVSTPSEEQQPTTNTEDQALCHEESIRCNGCAQAGPALCNESDQSL